MRISGLAFTAAIITCLLSCPAYAGGGKGASELGEDFQKQMPYSKEKPQSGEGQPQPRDYTAPPEREKPEARTPAQAPDYPLCYDPYTRTYEYCHPEDSDSFRMRLRSPDFRFWWESGRTCPPGYYFRPGWGCYQR